MRRLTKEEGGKQLPQVVHKTGRCLESHLIPLLQRKFGLHPVDPIQNACKANHCNIKRTVNITVTASHVACVVKYASAAVYCKELRLRHQNMSASQICIIGMHSHAHVCMHGVQVHA